MCSLLLLKLSVIYIRSRQYHDTFDKCPVTFKAIVQANTHRLSKSSCTCVSRVEIIPWQINLISSLFFTIAKCRHPCSITRLPLGFSCLRRPVVTAIYLSRSKFCRVAQLATAVVRPVGLTLRQNLGPYKFYPRTGIDFSVLIGRHYCWAYTIQVHSNSAGTNGMWVVCIYTVLWSLHADISIIC